MNEFLGLLIKYFFGNALFLLSAGGTLLGGSMEHRLDILLLGVMGVLLASFALVHTTKELKGAWMDLRSRI